MLFLPTFPSIKRQRIGSISFSNTHHIRLLLPKLTIWWGNTKMVYVPTTYQISPLSCHYYASSSYLCISYLRLWTSTHKTENSTVANSLPHPVKKSATSLLSTRCTILRLPACSGYLCPAFRYGIVPAYTTRHKAKRPWNTNLPHWKPDFWSAYWWVAPAATSAETRWNRYRSSRPTP